MAQQTLVLILGDQLSMNLSSLRSADRTSTHILMAEVHEEASYVLHHKKKIAFIFSAMRHFAQELEMEGWTVTYRRYDDAENSGSLGAEVEQLLGKSEIENIIVTQPGEWRLLEEMKSWSHRFSLPVDIRPDDRFIISSEEFAHWARGRKTLRMEHFYREVRRKTGLLMDGDQPAGGKWNYDSENRKPASDDLFMPARIPFEPDGITREVLELVANRFSNHFGDLEPFCFATTATQANTVLDGFIENALPKFGTYQDAMLEEHKFLYHSLLSFYINVGLLDPLTVCQRVEQAFRAGTIEINSAEGFIRQIIGWREYVRGIYWLTMPGYVENNFFAHHRDLPDFYWTGETKMNCLKAAITQTKEEAYAHHIQRLMVTGNFALLIGVEPKQIHEWYLAVYADAFEWVELPNTLGMSQFADGGMLGSKPYVSSGNYINKMSNYCSGCAYKVKEKTGPDACPFNALYWDFLVRHRERLKTNHRLGQVYRTWDRMAAEKQNEYLVSAAEFLDRL